MLIVKGLRACLVLLLGWLLAAPVAGANKGEYANATIPGVDDAVPMRVLFIGNSHTDRNGGMDWLVGNLVASADPGMPFDGSRRTASGVTLEYHYHNGALQAIREGDYDVVVLQDHLVNSPTRTDEQFLEYARLLDEEIRASGARTVFFMTWPQGRMDWADLDVLVEAHRRISAELNAPVAPVGVAMENARAERPDLDLIGADGIHATWAGAYLAAATIYATLFQRSPEGLPFTFGVSDDEAAFLQRIAWETVTEWQAGVYADAGGDAQAHTDAQAVAEAQGAPDSEASAEVRAATSADAGMDADAGGDAQASTEAGVEARASTGAQTGAGAQSASNPEARAGSDKDAGDHPPG
jgi:hypothetical protein